MNRNQTIAIAIVVLGILTTSTAQLTDILGAPVAHLVVSITSLVGSILAGVLGILTGQAGMIKDVAAMPGVERVAVNTQASPILAAVAVDPAQPKVGGTSDTVQAKLHEIAKG